MTVPMVRVDGLTVVDRSGRRILAEVTATLGPGRSLAVMGRSGSGKTTLGLALLGHLRPGLQVSGGGVRVGGADVFALRGAPLRSLRRHTVRYLPQDPAAALTPTTRVGRLITEAFGRADTADVEELTRATGLPAPEEIGRRFPHQLSGGQRQRLALCLALAGRPSVVVLDEPTSALDEATAADVVAHLIRLRSVVGCGYLVITHDARVAHRLGDEQLMLEAGRVSTRTRPLPTSTPAQAPGPVTAGTGGLTVTGLTASYAGPRGRRHLVLGDVDLGVRRGQCTVVMGPSGSGKTTLARCVAGLHQPDTGEIRLDDALLAPALTDRPAGVRRRIGMVFQDPYTSLNPARRVGHVIGRVARMAGADPRVQTPRLLARVGLGVDVADAVPAQLSGGERQRVAIARALAGRPDLLICDEVTSALDPENAAAIADLLDDVRASERLALLVISHDSALAGRLGHQLVVLREGRVTEPDPDPREDAGRVSARR